MPSRRAGPPFHMTEMIEAEPGLATRLLERLADPHGAAARLADAVREAAERGRPVILTGSGTSEHGALAAAAVISEALRATGLPAGPGERGAPLAVQAFEASLASPLGGPDSLVIGISHEGGTWATNRALERARTTGARVALITVSDRSPGARLADLVVTTDEQDQSWCHTVGYLSPILAAAAVAGHLTGRLIAAEPVRELLAEALRPPSVAAIEAAAGRLAAVDRLIVVASGADRAAGRELVLKVEEGAHLPAAYRDLETLLHGHLAGMDDRTGLVLLLADPEEMDDRAARAVGALRAAAEVRAIVGGILGTGYQARVDPDLVPAGRIVAGSATGLPSALGALLSTVVPLQLLTERLARARGVDPDPIRRDDPAYLRAAEAAG